MERRARRYNRASPLGRRREDRGENQRGEDCRLAMSGGGVDHERERERGGERVK